MSDAPEDSDIETPAPARPDRPAWSTGSFLAGLFLGATVGAGVALLLAPASGAHTRRVLRRRVRAMGREAVGGLVAAREEGRRSLREKKAALRERLEQMANTLD